MTASVGATLRGLALNSIDGSRRLVGKNVQVKLKLAGLNKLMRSDPVQAEVNKAAGRVAAKAGPKFRVNPSGKNAH